MRLRERLAGIFPPVVTNFDAAGEIAPAAFRDNVRRWVATPIDGIVLFGSNGEGALLDESEKARLTAIARETVPDGYLLIGGVSGESTRAAIRESRELAAQGADAVLVHPPSYFGPWLGPAAMLDFLTAIADASSLPVLVYHIPKYTKVTLEPQFVAELMQHPNVAGLKDSSGDLKRFADYAAACRECGADCTLLIGNGSLLLDALELGAAGGILGIANVVPALCAEVVQHHREGRRDDAARVQARLTPLHREIVAAHGAVGCKAALDLIGWAGGPPRPPLRGLDERERANVARVMQEVGVAVPA